MGMLISICFLLSACSEREEFESLVNRGIEEEEEVDVHLSLSSIPAISIEGDTDYRPMNTRAEGEIRSIIDNTYNCLVMKEIDSKWYVDTLLQQTLTSEGQWATIKVKEGMDFKDIQLTLRPGHYRVLAVLNPQSTHWNPDLVPGALVKGDGLKDTVAYAYTYFFATSSDHMNKGKRQVLKEVFSGIADFTVEKTSDVHSNPVNGDAHITLARKVMQIHFLLKDTITSGGLNFTETQYTVMATLKTTNEKAYFCDGVTCFGDPYYIQGGQTAEMDVCMSLFGQWRKSETRDARYLMSSYHTTIHSPFIFADERLTVPFQIENVKIYGQSGMPIYIYPQPITDLMVKNDTIQQIVFQNTDKVIGGNPIKITLEYLPDESALQLFGPYYECNIP